MISCKLHSSERIRAAYGATAAGEPSSCARLNRRTLDAVMASMTERQKKKMPFKGPVPVMLEPDLQASSEAEWLEAFTMVEADRGGTLRIRAKSLTNTGKVRVGTRAAANADRQYCHLIAPDYLKRILTGEVQLPKGEYPERGRTASR
jgi:D-aminopeptidase